MNIIFEWTNTSQIQIDVLPVSVDQIKERIFFLKVEDLRSNTSVNSSLESLIKLSTKFFEDRTSYMIYPRTLSGTMPYEDKYCYYYQFDDYRLSIRNVKTIDSIKYYPEDWNQDSLVNKTELDIATHYHIIPQSRISNIVLRRKSNAEFPIVYQGLNTLELNLTCGYDIVSSAFVGLPFDIKEFIIQHVAEMYINNLNGCDCAPSASLNEYLLQIISSYKMQYFHEEIFII